MKKFKIILLIILSIGNNLHSRAPIDNLIECLDDEVDYAEMYPNLAQGFLILQQQGNELLPLQDFINNKMAMNGGDLQNALFQASNIIIDGMNDGFCNALKYAISQDQKIEDVEDPIFHYVIAQSHDFMSQALGDWVNNCSCGVVQGRYPYTFLMEASKKNEVEIVNLLLDFGARTGTVFEFTGFSALHFAAMKNAAAAAELLIHAGADLNQLDRSGATPLIQAIKHKSLDVARGLIDAGADIAIIDDRGHNVERYAQLVGLEEWYVENIR